VEPKINYGPENAIHCRLVFESLVDDLVDNLFALFSRPPLSPILHIYDLSITPSSQAHLTRYAWQGSRAISRGTGVTLWMTTSWKKRRTLRHDRGFSILPATRSAGCTTAAGTSRLISTG
jgi:hypothetical protein